MAGGVRSTRLVPTVTLDWLAARFPAPDVLKIDVEGAELALKLISPLRPGLIQSDDGFQYLIMPIRLNV